MECMVCCVHASSIPSNPELGASNGLSLQALKKLSHRELVTKDTTVSKEQNHLI